MKSSSGDNTRKFLFDVFSENWEIVKSDPAIVQEGKDFSGYICPLCRGTFEKESLLEKKKKHLTLEDVPPKSLGGNVKLLTCNKCNNDHGSKLDKHLREYLLFKDFSEGVPEVSRRASFNPNGEWIIGGTIEKTKEGAFRLKAIKENSHHEHYDMMFKKGLIKPKKFNLKIDFGYNKRRSKVALLRIAYLWLVSEMGYVCLINEYMSTIREQINNPTKKLIKHLGSLSIEFPEEAEGINIVTSPKELKSFVVAFRLKTENSTRPFLVFLPGPAEPGLNIYNELNNYVQNEKKVHFKLKKLELEGFLTNRNSVGLYHNLWHHNFSE